MVLVPAVLMVSTIRFRSFKTIDLQIRRPYSVLLPSARYHARRDARANRARRHGVLLPRLPFRHGTNLAHQTSRRP